MKPEAGIRPGDTIRLHEGVVVECGSSGHVRAHFPGAPEGVNSFTIPRAMIAEVTATLKVGDDVTDVGMGGTRARIIAIDGPDAWVQFIPTGRRATRRLTTLRRADSAPEPATDRSLLNIGDAVRGPFLGVGLVIGLDGDHVWVHSAKGRVSHPRVQLRTEAAP